MNHIEPPRDAEPLVSVLCATFNYGRYVARAIESVLTQTYAKVEMIVVDDGSTDETPSVLAKFGERITALSQANAGQNAAFNRAFHASSGQIVCILDADDVMEPHKIASSVAAFRRFTNAQWLFHDLGYQDLRTLQMVGAPVTAQQQLPPSGSYDLRPSMRRGSLPLFAPAASGLVFTRALFERISPLPELPQFGDHYLKFAAAALEPGIVLNEALAIQGVHGANAYTDRSDIGLFRARRWINVADHLFRVEPQVVAFCDLLIARGLAASALGRHLPAAERVTVRRLLREANYVRRARIVRLTTGQVWQRGRRGLRRRAMRH